MLKPKILSWLGLKIYFSLFLRELWYYSVVDKNNSSNERERNMTMNEWKLLTAIRDSEFHDGRDPVDSHTWVDCLKFDSRSHAGTMSSLSKKDLAYTDGETCWITQKGFDAITGKAGADWLIKSRKAREARKAREQIMRDCGLVKVRGALGGIYWE